MSTKSKKLKLDYSHKKKVYIIIQNQQIFSGALNSPPIDFHFPTSRNPTPSPADLRIPTISLACHFPHFEEQNEETNNKEKWTQMALPQNSLLCPLPQLAASRNLPLYFSGKNT